MIIETFAGQGVAVDSIVAGGGLAKNAFLMQIYADITGCDIALAGSNQASALGAATKVYHPIAEHIDTYNVLYAEYRRLYDYFGRGENNVMKVLRNLRKK